ncbi:hypothetical protein SAMN05192558_11711 [Actinokineospora alba]|uniref:Ca2+-binding protein, RTX toxin-related n=1 Tax=Actinokineospora alba TaxID=504798 RepID=A0A1H0W1I9_9PSEU|nr:hypothetical protein [Actinokineospora alba]TDP67768.1 hypothetical protein C8E96_3319 [Actinokineospora alba]SDI71511.1 hypothetical protein SAMN05421871_10711 [Actinokineospora alba]SDP84559.1 hypothetical protein SAMN05192558_11711 [Actinokineospora alba]
MFRNSRRTVLRAFIASVAVVGQVGLGVSAAAEPTPTPTAPSPVTPTTPAAPAPQPLAPSAPGAAVLDVPDLGPIEVGPDGHVPVNREKSKALQDIQPLPGLNPAPGKVPIERAPVTPQPPVSPYPLTMPQRPGQELVDATARDALATLGRAGRLKADGTPDLDATKLQPQVSSAQVIDPTRPATIQELIDALLSGNIPPPLPVDPLALLNELPDGIPRITYRVCSESATKQVSCSLTLPLGVPAIVDVTGDRTPDVLADLLPAVAVGDILGPVREILDLERQVKAVTDRLNILAELLKDPLNVILHPEWVLEKLALDDLLRGLNATLQQKLTALLDLINVGLAFLELRLPTSEFAGRDLPGHVWAVYDIPSRKRLSLGFDGFRRGSSLPTGTLGIFTLNPIRALQGIFDIKATLLSAGAGDSMAITAGMASVRDDSRGDAYDPTVASSRFSPVPNFFHAHAYLDPGAADRGQRATVDSSSNVRTHLDAQVLSNRPESSRFDQLKVDTLPTTVSATVTRPVGGGEADVDYRADSTIDDVLFADYVYSGQRLDWALQAGAKAVPATWHANFKTAQDKVTANYTASSRLAALDVNFYDRDPAIVGRGSLRDLPTRLDVLVDRAASHVDLKAEQAIGSAALAFSKNLGDYAPLDGDHATVITRDQKIGASARISGLKRVDAYYDSHPRLDTVFEPGGQAFVGAGDIDGVHKARLEVSNLPATLSVDADTANRKISYRASDVIHRVHVAYTNTRSGPTLFGTVHELPSIVDLTYDVGAKPRLLYKASSRIPRIELFASLAHIETLRPSDDYYLSALTTGVPTSVDVLVDLEAKHLRGALAETMDGINVVARAPLGGRDWTAITEFGSIPTEFDADWADGNYRFRAITAPLGSARLAVTNHRDTVAPTGLHAAVHYRQSTGDLDASMRVRNLTHVEYSKTEGNQTFRLDTDTGGAPVFVDAEAILAADTDDTVDDTKFAVAGRVDNLPSTIRVDYGDGKLSYGANRNIGLALDVAFGKIAALNGLGAPLFGNGVAAVARGCADGTGCKRDESAFCKTFPRCFGVVGTVSLPGLPTAITVDLNARTVVLDDYRPTGPLQAYIGVHGLIDALPDFKAMATLAGVPSPVDLTVGPIDVGGGKVDVGYTASGALGTLTLDVDAHTTDQRFPVLRGKASVSKLPASMRVTGQLGDRTSLSMRNSASVDEIALTVTGDRVGHLRAAVRGVPAQADVVVDATAKHAEVTMSAPISAVTALVRDIPVAGRNWSAYGDLRDIPAKFTADWADGNYRLDAVSPLGSAAFAVTNHGGATSPVGPHFAGHFRELTQDMDGSALIAGLRSVTYTKDKTGSKATLDMGATRIAFDGDAVFAANGADDTRIAATALLDTPNTVEIGMTAGKITYKADKQAGFQAEAYLGKVAALGGLGAPLFENGIAARGRSCQSGAGCVKDESPFCTLFANCFGAVATVNLPGLPKTVTVDLKTKQVDLTEYSPAAGGLRLYASLDGLVDKVPHAAGLVTLSGLSPTLNHLTVGPFHPADADPRGFTYAHDAHGASLGGVDVRVEAKTADFGTVYGAANLSNVPGKVTVNGLFGSKSTVRAVASEGIGSLTAHVTAALQGNPASGRLSVTDVPAKLDFEITGFGKGAVGAPTITYNGKTAADAAQSTLDGSAEIEGDLIKAFPIGGVNIPLAGNAYAGFTDLGATTTVVLNEDTSVAVDSTPKTAELKLGATVHTSYAVQQIDLEVFNEDTPVGNAKGTLTGHAGVPKIEIEDFQLVLSGFKRIRFVPGANLSYLTTGIEGDFEKVYLKFGGLTIEPDVDLKFHVDIPGPDQEVKLKLDKSNTIKAIRFHLADQELRLSRKFDFSLACLAVSTLPGKFATSENEITIDGTPGQTVRRTLNYLDPVPSPLGIDPKDMSFGIDMLTAYYTHPFNEPAARAAYDWSAGGC